MWSGVPWRGSRRRPCGLPPAGVVGGLEARHRGIGRGGDRIVRRVGGERQRDGHIGAACLFDQSFRSRDAVRPVGGGGPVIVDHQRQRPCLGERVAMRVEHRAGQCEDHQRREEHSERRQPPGAGRRRFLAFGDAGEDGERRKDLARRARRGDAQQPPDGGKRCQRHEQDRIGKTESPHQRVLPWPER